MKNIMLENGVIVHPYHVICTNLIVIGAFEPIPKHDLWDDIEFSAIMTLDSEKYGAIATKRPPKDICDDLHPIRGEARVEAVTAWYNNQAERAYSLVRQAFPDLDRLEHVRVRKFMGDIELWFESVEAAKAFKEAYDAKEVDNRNG